MADEYTSDPASIIAQSQSQGVPDSSFSAHDFLGAARSATSGTPTWHEFRKARAAQSAGQDPVLLDVTRAHHEALADATRMAQIADHNLSTYHAAQIMADTGGFLNEVHGVHVTDPQYEQKITALHAKYPMNRVTGEHMRAMNEGRQLYLKANSELAMHRQEEQDTKHVYDAISKGYITPDEVTINPATNQPVNPSLWDATPDGGGKLNVSRVRLLAAARASGQAPGGVNAPSLTEEERAVLKMFPDAKSAQQLTQSSDDNPLIKAQKNLFWSAMGKINRPKSAAPAAAPAATPAGTTGGTPSVSQYFD